MSAEITSDPTSKAPAKSLNIALWVAQALLAVVFFSAGAMKLTTPIEVLATQMAWVTGPLGNLVVFIGAAEVAGALGLILPAATRILPRLTVLAALGLLTIMVLAAITHATRDEWSIIPANVVLGGLAAFVAWGRAKKVPISPR